MLLLLYRNYYRKKLPSLKDRRTQASLCHFFKIMHGLTEFADAPVHPMTFIHNSLDNSYIPVPPIKLLFVHYSQELDYIYQCSFFPTIISIWNSLPKEATQCKALASFKNFILSSYICNYKNYFVTFSFWITLILAYSYLCILAYVMQN